MNIQILPYPIENKWIITKSILSSKFNDLENKPFYFVDEKTDSLVLTPSVESLNWLQKEFSNLQPKKWPDLVLERAKIVIEVFDKHILLKMPKNEIDITFIRSLKYSQWSGQWFHWKIPNYPGNLNGSQTDCLKKLIESLSCTVNRYKYALISSTDTACGPFQNEVPNAPNCDRNY